jgi:hypothetical protein
MDWMPHRGHAVVERRGPAPRGSEPLDRKASNWMLNSVKVVADIALIDAKTSA